MSTTKNSSPALIDNFNRRMDYLRLAVTDRCNLRCRYCMPEEGVRFEPKENILTWEEMYRICRILVENGLRKIRITGGEPLVRKGLVPFLAELNKLQPRPIIGITTNGVLLSRYLPELKEAGLKRLNISLDSLNPDTYFKIARRNNFEQTWKSLNEAVEMGFSVKLNMVIQQGINDHEITDLAVLTKTMPLTVRYIEPMPFAGADSETFETFSGDMIKQKLEQKFILEADSTDSDTVATRFRIPGHVGRIGIIHAYSRTFCASCSRMRISAQGQMRTCLYGQNVLDLRELIRCGSSDEIILNAIRNVLQKRFENGFEAEKHRLDSYFESMSTIGG